MKIALLEDEERTALTFIEWLKEAGHEVSWFESGMACIRALQNEHYDLYLLDWTLPNVNGLQVMEHIKIIGILRPVIFISKRGTEEDVAHILKLGADDYIIKPASKIIFLARVNALLRRSNALSQKFVKYGRLSVYFIQYRIYLDDVEVKLTDKETYLALYLFKYIGTLITRNHIAQVVWGYNTNPNSRTIDVHISKLRDKLKLTPEYGWRLNCVNRQGYRLERMEF